jgi:uncharacterized protein YbjT (DUF2867 family)
MESGILVQNYKILFIIPLSKQNQMPRSALIIGATGLTGSCLLDLLLVSDQYQRVIVYTRHATGIKHAKLDERLVDFDHLDTPVEADDVFCCIGTTMKKAGSKEAFRKVDLGIPLKIAALQRKAGSAHFFVVSAMGASIHSTIFYSRIKGEMEEGLKALHYPSLVIFRPSLITGNRKEKRTAELIGVFLGKFLSPLLIGPLKKYAPVSARTIARSMLAAAMKPFPGTRLVLSGEIKKS